MRDVVWTLIVIWLIYRLVDMFKKKPTQEQNHQNSNTQFNTNSEKPSTVEEKIKNALHKQIDKEGEYVDYEEVK